MSNHQSPIFTGVEGDRYTTARSCERIESLSRGFTAFELQNSIRARPPKNAILTYNNDFPALGLHCFFAFKTQSNDRWTLPARCEICFVTQTPLRNHRTTPPYRPDAASQADDSLSSRP